MPMVVSFLQLAHMSTRGDQTCVVYSIDHKTYVVYRTVQTRQTYAAYIMDTLRTRCLQYGPINLILLMERTHQTYIAYSKGISILCF